MAIDTSELGQAALETLTHLAEIDRNKGKTLEAA